jgi:predicted dehydrogenase
MIKVVLLGAGQIGFRHLQGLVQINEPGEVYIIDPDDRALANAAEHLSYCKSSLQLNFLQNPDAVPQQIDVVISATAAPHRLMSLRSLLGGRSVSAVLLEKVLFQRLEEYNECALLLKQAGAKAWVNCPRRLWPIYQSVRERFSSGQIEMEVVGEGWGLACNGIHFLDLFNFLTGEASITFNLENLSERLYPAKREGFVELMGTLVGHAADGSIIRLTASVGSAPTLSVTIRNSRYEVIIIEGKTAKIFCRQSGELIDDIPAAPVFQSALTGPTTITMVQGRDPGLADYSLSANLHRAFIRALSKHIDAVAPGIYAGCPIT